MFWLPMTILNKLKNPEIISSQATVKLKPQWLSFALTFRYYQSTMRSLYASLLVVLVIILTSTLAENTRNRNGFRVNVDTVVIRVTVTDPLNRYVLGLDKSHFRIFEDKVEQTVTHFSRDIAPISVGVIIDMSGSMGDNILSARSSVMRFLEQGNPADEYFLVIFNNRSALVQDFTSRSENIQNQVSMANPRGRTALYDAVYLGLEKIRDAKNEKKALQYC